MDYEDHCDRTLHPNLVRIYGGMAEKEVADLPSITIHHDALERFHLKMNPKYVDDGDINFPFEQECARAHFRAVAWRPTGASSMYRFYFKTEEEAAFMKMTL